MMRSWLERPDQEGFWWVLAKDGSDRERRTVACVSVLDPSGIIIFHLIGYHSQFTDQDLEPGRPLVGSRWKWIPQS